ncbi:MAG: cysteine--tRNA ligase [Bacteroidia bacterium]
MSSLKVYNTLTRTKEDFIPITPGRVGMYVCGPTVYGNPHLGHARSALTFDIVFRYLKYSDYKVRYVRNITDVGHLVGDGDEGESKVEKKARLEQLEPMEVAQHYYNAYIDALNQLNIERPSIEPRATGHIPEQIAAVEKIIAEGYGYESNGSVYFDVTAYNKDFPYGELSGRDLENILAGSRDNLEGGSEKRHPADFALWKKADPTHIMRWESPWGDGFPGWHLECTVMSTKYLGTKYDIHGGGMDLIFPHHEAEIAQSNACNCNEPSDVHGEANYWLHNNMITLNGQKMGKSLGNAIDLVDFYAGNHDLLEKAYSPMNIRFFILQAHYRSTLDFSNDALQASEKGYLRLSDALKRIGEINTDGKAVTKDNDISAILENFKSKFEAEMNDDFHTAKALTVMFEAASAVNQIHSRQHEGLLVEPETLASFAEAYKAAFYDVLGLVPPLESGEKDSAMGGVLDGLMELVIDLRAGARNDKNWAVSDQIRDKLNEINIQLKDTAEGTEWRVG